MDTEENPNGLYSVVLCWKESLDDKERKKEEIKQKSPDSEAEKCCFNYLPDPNKLNHFPVPHSHGTHTGHIYGIQWIRSSLLSSELCFSISYTHMIFTHTFYTCR